MYTQWFQSIVQMSASQRLMVNALHVDNLLSSVGQRGRKVKIKLAAMLLPAQVDTDTSCNGVRKQVSSTTTVQRQ